MIEYRMIFTLLIVSALLGCGQLSESRIEVNDQHRLNIDGSKILYNGSPLPFDAPISEWTAILGPSRTYGRRHIWDEIGITADLESVAESVVDGSLVSGDNVRELNIYLRGHFEPVRGEPVTVLRDWPCEYYPENGFPTDLVLNECVMGRDSEQAEIDRRTTDGGLPLSLQHIYSLGDHEVYFVKKTNDTLLGFPIDFCEGKTFKTVMFFSPDKSIDPSLVDILKFRKGKKLDRISVEVTINPSSIKEPRIKNAANVP